MFLLRRLLHFCSPTLYTTAQYMAINSRVFYWYRNGKMRTQKKTQGITFCLRALVTSVTCEVLTPGSCLLLEPMQQWLNCHRGFGGNSAFLILHATVLLLIGTTKDNALPLSCLPLILTTLLEMAKNGSSFVLLV